MSIGNKKDTVRPKGLAPGAHDTDANVLIGKGREKERKRIAQELHDGVLQSLSAVNIVLGQVTDQQRVPAKRAVANDLSRIARQIRNCVKEIRAITEDLEPPELDGVDLVEAMHRCIDALQARHPLQVLRHMESIEAGLTARHKLGLFRIFQEALNNVAKHADATRVEVVLRQAGEILHLTIKDNGRGLAGCPDENRCYGLRNMRSRALALGGSIEIHSPPYGSGVIVAAQIPLAERLVDDGRPSEAVSASS